MKKFISLALMSMLLALQGSAETLFYKVSIRLNVPRVFDNMQSLGYRKMQWQSITGYVAVDMSAPDKSSCEPVVYAYNFVNRTHKVQGSRVTYLDAWATDVMWRYIGSNKTNVFRKPNVKFSLDMNPSYNIGDDEPDNTLIMTLAGSGSSDSLIIGRITGQIGCGCMAYGHISPTRTVDGRVSDIVPLYGTFTMRLVSRSMCRLDKED